MRNTDLVIVLALSSVAISRTKGTLEVDGKSIERDLTPLQLEEKGQRRDKHSADNAQKDNNSYVGESQGGDTYAFEGGQRNESHSFEETRITDETEKVNNLYVGETQGNDTSPFETEQRNGSYSFAEQRISDSYFVEETRKEDDYYVQGTEKYDDYPFEEKYINDTYSAEEKDERKLSKELDNTQADLLRLIHDSQSIRREVEKLEDEINKSVEFVPGTQTTDHESLISWKSVAREAETLFNMTRNMSLEDVRAQRKIENDETMHNTNESEKHVASVKRHVKAKATTPKSSTSTTSSPPTSMLKIMPLHELEKLNCGLEAIRYGHDHEAGISAHEVFCEIRKLWHLLLLAGKNMKYELSVGPQLDHEDDGTLSLHDLTSSKLPSTLIEHGPTMMEALIKDPNHLSIIPDILKESIPLVHLIETLHRLHSAGGKFFHVLHDSFGPHLEKHDQLGILKGLHGKILAIAPDFLKMLNDHVEMDLSKEESNVPAKSMDPEGSATMNILEKAKLSQTSLTAYLQILKEAVDIMHSVYGAYHASGFSDFLKSAKGIFSEISPEDITEFTHRILTFNKGLSHSKYKSESKLMKGAISNNPQIVATSPLGEISIRNPFPSKSTSKNRPNLDKLPLDALKSGLASSSSAASSAVKNIQDIPQKIAKFKGSKGAIFSDPQTLATSPYTQATVKDETFSSPEINNRENLVKLPIDDLQSTSASSSSAVFSTVDDIKNIPQKISAQLKNTIPFDIAETSASSSSSTLVSLATVNDVPLQSIATNEETFSPTGNEPTLIKLPIDTLQSTLSSSSSAVSTAVNDINDVSQKVTSGMVNLSPVNVAESSSDCDPATPVLSPEPVETNGPTFATSTTDDKPTFINGPLDNLQSTFASSASAVSSAVSGIKEVPQKFVSGITNLSPIKADVPSPDCDPSSLILPPEPIKMDPSNSLTLATQNQPTFVNMPADSLQSTSLPAISSSVNNIKDVPQNIVSGLVNLWPKIISESSSSASSSSATNLSPATISSGLLDADKTSVIENQPNLVKIVGDTLRSSASSLPSSLSSAVSNVQEVPQNLLIAAKPSLPNNNVVTDPCSDPSSSSSSSSSSSVLSSVETRPLPFDVPFSYLQSTSSASSVSSAIEDTSRNILAVVKEASPFKDVPSSLKPFFPSSDAESAKASSAQTGPLDGTTSTASEERSALLNDALRLPITNMVESAVSNGKQVSQGIFNVPENSQFSMKERERPTLKKRTKVLSARNQTVQKTRENLLPLKGRPFPPRKITNSSTGASSVIKTEGESITPAIHSALSPILKPVTDLLSATAEKASSPNLNPPTIKENSDNGILSSLIPHLTGGVLQKDPKSLSTNGAGDGNTRLSNYSGDISTTVLRFPQKTPSAFGKEISRISPPQSENKSYDAPSKSVTKGDPSLRNQEQTEASTPVTDEQSPSSISDNFDKQIEQLTPPSRFESPLTSESSMNSAPLDGQYTTNNVDSTGNLEGLDFSVSDPVISTSPSNSPSSEATPDFHPKVAASAFNSSSIPYSSPTQLSSTSTSSMSISSDPLRSASASSVLALPTFLPSPILLSRLTPSNSLPSRPLIPEPALLIPSLTSFLSSSRFFPSSASSSSPPSPPKFFMPFWPSMLLKNLPSALLANKFKFSPIGSSPSLTNTTFSVPSVAPSSPLSSSPSSASSPTPSPSLSSVEPPSSFLLPSSAPKSEKLLTPSLVPSISPSSNTLSLASSASSSSALPQSPSVAPSLEPSWTYISPSLESSSLTSSVQSPSSSLILPSSADSALLAPSSSSSSILSQSPSLAPSSESALSYISPLLESSLPHSSVTPPPPSLPSPSSPDSTISLTPYLKSSSSSSSALSSSPSLEPSLSSYLPISPLPSLVPSSSPSSTVTSSESSSSSNAPPSPYYNPSSSPSSTFSAPSLIPSLLPSSAPSSSPSTALPLLPSSSSSSSSSSLLSVTLPIANGTLNDRTLKISLELPRDKIQSALGTSFVRPGDVISLALKNGTAMFGHVTDAVSPISFSYLRPDRPNGKLWRLRLRDFRDPECQKQLESLIKNTIRPS